MSPPAAQPRRKPRRVRERPLWSALLWSLFAVAALGLTAFEADLHWPNSPLNNLWNLLIVNGQVSPDNPLIAQFIRDINQQDLLFLSYACLLGGGITLGRLAPLRASRSRVLAAAAGATIGIAVLCLVSAWSLQLHLQGGHLLPHQIDAALVAIQLGWTVSWVLVYVAGTVLGLRWRDRRKAGQREADAANAVLPARLRS